MINIDLSKADDLEKHGLCMMLEGQMYKIMKEGLDHVEYNPPYVFKDHWEAMVSRDKVAENNAYDIKFLEEYSVVNFNDYNIINEMYLSIKDECLDAIMRVETFGDN